MTLVIGHRTCAGYAPENSLTGIERAPGLGADMVEVDVRRALDGTPVLMHDAVPVRLTRWPLPVRWTPLWVWRRLRVRDDGRPPTFGEALAALPEGLGVAVDLKDAGAGPAALAEVRRRGLDGRVLLWVRDPAAVRWLADHAPHIEHTLLRDSRTDDDHRRYLDDAIACGAGGVSLHQSAVVPWVLDEARARGLSVYAWLQTEAEHDRLAGAALDGVVTDWPTLARPRFPE